MRTLERAHKRRRICDDVLFIHLVWQEDESLRFCVCICVCARVRFCVCIHPVEISIEKVTPLSSLLYTPHPLHVGVSVSVGHERNTSGWIGIKRGNAVWLKEEGIVWRYCQKSAFLECFTKCILQLDAGRGAEMRLKCSAAGLLCVLILPLGVEIDWWVTLCWYHSGR